MPQTSSLVDLVAWCFPGQWVLKRGGAQHCTNTPIMASSLVATVVEFLLENKIGKTMLI